MNNKESFQIIFQLKENLNMKKAISPGLAICLNAEVGYRASLPALIQNSHEIS